MLVGGLTGAQTRIIHPPGGSREVTPDPESLLAILMTKAYGQILRIYQISNKKLKVNKIGIFP